jgi:hypothetical protein
VAALITHGNDLRRKSAELGRTGELLRKTAHQGVLLMLVQVHCSKIPLQSLNAAPIAGRTLGYGCSLRIFRLNSSDAVLTWMTTS